MEAVLDRVPVAGAGDLPRIDYSRLVERHLRIPDDVREGWRRLVDETVRAGRAEELHAARGEYQAIVRGWADELGGFLALCERVADGNGHAPPLVGDLRRKAAELAAFSGDLFARWQTLDDLYEILVEQFRLPVDQVREYAKAHPPPQSWYDEDMSGLFADDEGQP